MGRARIYARKSMKPDQPEPDPGSSDSESEGSDSESAGTTTTQGLSPNSSTPASQLTEPNKNARTGDSKRIERSHVPKEDRKTGPSIPPREHSRVRNSVKKQKKVVESSDPRSSQDVSSSLSSVSSGAALESFSSAVKANVNRTSVGNAGEILKNLRFSKSRSEESSNKKVEVGVKYSRSQHIKKSPVDPSIDWKEFRSIASTSHLSDSDGAIDLPVIEEGILMMPHSPPDAILRKYLNMRTAVATSSDLATAPETANSPSLPRLHPSPPRSQGPQPFPLPPPVSLPIFDATIRQSVTLSEREEDDVMPTLEQMLAKTRPSQSQGPPSSASAPVRSRKDNQPENKTHGFGDERNDDEDEHDRMDIDKTTLITISGIARTQSIIEVTSSPPRPTPRSFIQPSRQSQSQSQAGPSSQGKPTLKRKSITDSTPIYTPPNSKRAKPASSASYRILKHTKHPKHWELDGNVLVQIKGVRYKLQRSRLARLSGWFRDAFEKGTKESYLEGEEPNAERVHVLDGAGVKVKDFEVLLDSLDNAITFYYTEPSFHTMASILRASTALEFTDFADWSSRYLQEMWSPELLDLTTERLPYATQSVVLARECDVLSVLKRALYELVRLEGFGQDSDEEGNRNAMLSSADYRALVKAREKLISLWTLSAAAPSRDFAHCLLPSAEEREACTASHMSRANDVHTKLVHTSGMFEEYMCDPISGFQALIDAPWADEGFCDECVQVRQMAWGKAREKVWENLKIWFGLAGD